MREETIKVYKFEELSDDAKEKARTWYRESVLAYDRYSQDEMVDSLKALFKAAGIKLKDYSLGNSWNRDNHVRFDMGDAGALSGKRAWAWLENNLFKSLRIYKTWQDGPGLARWDGEKHRHYSLKDARSYGYRLGEIPSCPLTGVCYDDDFIDALREAVKDGDTLEEAFAGLASTFAKIADAEDEYRNSEEAVDESLTINEYEFREDGTRHR